MKVLFLPQKIVQQKENYNGLSWLQDLGNSLPEPQKHEKNKKMIDFQLVW